MERKLQDGLDCYCKYKCNKQEIENNIMDMLHGDINDAWIDGNICDICMIKEFIGEIRDEL